MNKPWKAVLIFAVSLTTFLSANVARAELDLLRDVEAPRPQKNYLTAQAEDDDTYDPFTDYSEFDEASSEEADINFFRNGRFFTLGLAAGMRQFTGNLNKLYGSGATYGILISYFFDLNLALQIGFLTGDYPFGLNFTNSSGSTVSNTGTVSVTLLNFDFKYYLNTQNVTKGLADLNPYLIFGVSQAYRTYTLTGVAGLSREAGMALDGGVGIEIPILRRKSFFGVQGVLHYTNFQDANTPLVGVDPGTGDQIQTTAKPQGMTWDLLGIIGLNF